MCLWFPSLTLSSIGILAVFFQFAFSLQLSPSRIRFEDVSQAYEDTLLRKLFSSVPRREFALNAVSFDLEAGTFLVILGASSSGKSTILRLLQGTEQPVSGSIYVESTSRPIYLDRKPYFDDRRTIETFLLERFEAKEIGVAICALLELDEKKTTSDLTASESYKFALVEACMASMAEKYPCAPILLLDEWMDMETSTVVHKVEKAILQLTQHIGAIILCVSHRPNLFRHSHESMTMCRGEILSRGRTK
jgi:ABC-type multidrug transport system fused ATPase/permease subunit